MQIDAKPKTLVCAVPQRESGETLPQTIYETCTKSHQMLQKLTAVSVDGARGDSDSDVIVYHKIVSTPEATFCIVVLLLCELLAVPYAEQ